jgi:hypothetical protein
VRPNISGELARIMNNSPIAMPTTATAAREKNKCAARRCQIPTTRYGKAIAAHAPINTDQMAVTQLISMWP